MARLFLLSFCLARLQAGHAVEDDSTAFIQVATERIRGLEDTEDTEALFHRFDADSSGTLTIAELSSFLKNTWMPAVTPAQVRKIMRKSDSNTDFYLNITEFIGCASDPPACDMEVPESVLAVRAAKATAATEILPGLAIGSAESPDIAADFLPEEATSSLRQVERCTESDRVILREHGMDLSRADPIATDAVHSQTVQIKGAWVQTLILPQACRATLQHVGRIDRTSHAQCLKDALNITIPCARCNTDFLHTLVHVCASACTPSLNSRACVDCSKPLKLLECVEGKNRFAKMQLIPEDVACEIESGDRRIVGGDTPTGELITVDKEEVPTILETTEENLTSSHPDVDADAEALQKELDRMADDI